MNIVFSINGGIGKCIAATAVCEAIKKQHSNSTLIIISGYPEVFISNPNVDRTFAHGHLAYFYSDYIEGKDFKVFAHDPYLDTAFINQNEHLIKTWTEMFGVKYNGEQPKIYLTERELAYIRNRVQSDKPVMVMQTNGGAPNQEVKYGWARDIPYTVATQVVAAMKDTHNIIHIRREDQVALPDTTPIHDNFRNLFALISLSDKRLFMDSFGQHAAAALNLPSTVLWIGNSPTVFGYAIHDNIQAKPYTSKPELRQSVFTKFDFTGNPMEFPYNSESEIFDAEKVIESLKK